MLSGAALRLRERGWEATFEAEGPAFALGSSGAVTSIAAGKVPR
jgi:hypothetical protein